MLPRLAMTTLGALLAASSAHAQAAWPPDTTTFFSGNASEHVRPMVGAGLYKTNREVGYYLNGGVSISEGYSDFDASASSTSSTVTDRYGTGYFFNVGASLPVNSMVTVYGGVGLAGVSGATETGYGTASLLSEAAPATETSEDVMATNYNAGILVSTGRVVFEAGYNSYFETGYLGIGFGF